MTTLSKILVRTYINDFIGKQLDNFLHKNSNTSSICFSEKFGLTPSQFQKKYAI